MSELYLQVGTSDISCFREVKVESRNWRIFVSEIVSSDFDIAGLVDAQNGWTHKMGGRTKLVDAQNGWTHKVGGRTKWVDAQIGWTHRDQPEQDQT